jgi:hypothetical protein
MVPDQAGVPVMRCKGPGGRSRIFRGAATASGQVARLAYVPLRTDDAFCLQISYYTPIIAVK